MADYKRHTTPSGVEQLADVEFAVDVLGGDPDPLLRLGFDPSVARAVNEGPLGARGGHIMGETLRGMRISGEKTYLRALLAM